MIPSRATSIRSYRIINKSLFALALCPGSLEWSSKRREIVKFFPHNSEILEALEKEMAPAILQISRQALTGDTTTTPGGSDPLLSVGSDENTSLMNSMTTNTSQIALHAIQKAIRETFRLKNEELLSVKYYDFLKSFLDEKQMQDVKTVLGTNNSNNNNNKKNNIQPSDIKEKKKMLITLIGMHRQKLIFEALRTINGNVSFYTDRFWWRCFPVGGGVVMDKSTRWAQTPSQLGDTITEAMKTHYRNIKEVEREQELSTLRRKGSKSYPIMNKASSASSSSSSLTSASSGSNSSPVANKAEEAAGATNPYAAAVYRSGNCPSANERLARSALFRLSFSAAGIYSIVSPSSSSSNNSNTTNNKSSTDSSASSATANTTTTAEEHQREKLLMHFPKLSSSTTSGKKFSFDASQAVIAELYLRARKALAFHAFFAELTSEIERFAPCDDWRFFAELIQANVRDGLDEKVAELLGELPDPAEITSFTQLRVAAVKAHTSILNMLLNPSESAVSINNNSNNVTGRKNTHQQDKSTTDTSTKLEGDDEANPLEKIEKSNIKRKRQELLDLANRHDVASSELSSDNPEEDLEKLTSILAGIGNSDEPGAARFFKNEHQQNVENVLSELPAEVLIRMVSHIVECCLQYCNEGVEEASIREKMSLGMPVTSFGSTKSGSQSPGTCFSPNIRTLLPVFEIDPLLARNHQHSGNSSSQNQTTTTTIKEQEDQPPLQLLPPLQHRLSLHGAIFLIAGVMARLGIPWRTMKGNVPQQAPSGSAYFSSSASSSASTSGSTAGDLLSQEEEGETFAATDERDEYPQRKRYQRFTPENLEEARRERLQEAKKRSLALSRALREEEEGSIETLEGSERTKLVDEETFDLMNEEADAIEFEEEYYDRIVDDVIVDDDNRTRADKQDTTDDTIVDHRRAEGKSRIKRNRRKTTTLEEMYTIDPPSTTKQRSPPPPSQQQNRDLLLHYVEQKRKQNLLSPEERQEMNNVEESSTKSKQTTIDPEALAYLENYRHNHFDTVDIEGEQASPPNYIELQLNGITVVEAPKTTSTSSTTTTKLFSEEEKEETHITTAKDENSKTAVDNEGDDVKEAKAIAEERLQEEQQKVGGNKLITQHRLFPVFIELYRTSNESPIINGSVIAPRDLAAYVRNALILEYTNIGILREKSSSRSSAYHASPSVAPRQRRIWELAERSSSSSAPKVSPVPWSKGPRQDPILGLTSHICHSHLTKCEILAFDEMQGEKERNRHMTLLRDATNLWTSVLQLF